MIARSSPKDAQVAVLDTPFLPSSAIYVGSGGDLTLLFANGNQITFSGVPGGGWFPVEAVQIVGSLTTATGLIVGYY